MDTPAIRTNTHIPDEWKHPYVPVAVADEREQWLEIRQTGIGASEIAAVLGENPWVPAIGVWRRKTTKVDPDDDENERMFWGNQLERAIIDGFAHRTGRPTVRCGILLRSATHPWLIGTPDALTTTDRIAERHADRLTSLAHAITLSASGPGFDPWAPDVRELVDEFATFAKAYWPLQVKNSGEFAGSSWADGAPAYYRLQGQHEAIVMGAPRATICGLIGGNKLAWEDVDVDELARIRIIHEGTRFWQENVLARTPPVPDGTDACRRLLAQMFPEEVPGKTIPLPMQVRVSDDPAADLMSIEDLDDALQLAKQVKKDAEAEIDRLGNILRLAIGDAEFGLLPSGECYSYKLQSRKGYTVGPSSARVLTRRKNLPKAQKNS